MGGEAGVEGSDGGGAAAAADCDVLVRQLRHCLTLDKIVGILVGLEYFLGLLVEMRCSFVLATGIVDV
ncbi:hypothetical protein AAC387_Pa04g2294 [Persea americana]